MTRWATTLLLVGFTPLVAGAHSLGVEVKQQGQQVYLEAYFDNDTPGENALVMVTDAAGQAIAQGQTDEKGVWSFPPLAPGTYHVVVKVIGHRAQTTFTIAAPVSVETPTTVSQGTSRASSTGPIRWLLVGLGLVVIAMLTFSARYLSRAKANTA